MSTVFVPQLVSSLPYLGLTLVFALVVGALIGVVADRSSPMLILTLSLAMLSALAKGFGLEQELSTPWAIILAAGLLAPAFLMVPHPGTTPQENERPFLMFFAALNGLMIGQGYFLIALATTLIVVLLAKIAKLKKPSLNLWPRQRIYSYCEVVFADEARLQESIKQILRHHNRTLDDTQMRRVGDNLAINISYCQNDAKDLRFLDEITGLHGIISVQR